MKTHQPHCPYCQQPTELEAATVYEDGLAFHYLCAMLWRRTRGIAIRPTAPAA
jgi:hypothetical protein